MLRRNADVRYLFIDFQEAYDIVWRKGIWSEMREVGLLKKIVHLCRILSDEMYAKVKICKHLSSEFKVNKDLR